MNQSQNTNILLRHRAIQNHIDLLEERYPEPVRREAVAALLQKLKNLRRGFTASLLLWFASWISRLPITKRLSLVTDRLLIMADRFKQ